MLKCWWINSHICLSVNQSIYITERQISLSACDIYNHNYHCTGDWDLLTNILTRISLWSVVPCHWCSRFIVDFCLRGILSLLNKSEMNSKWCLILSSDTRLLVEHEWKHSSETSLNRMPLVSVLPSSFKHFHVYHRREEHFGVQILSLPDECLCISILVQVRCFAFIFCSLFLTFFAAHNGKWASSLSCFKRRQLFGQIATYIVSHVLRRVMTFPCSNVKLTLSTEGSQSSFFGQL